METSLISIIVPVYNIEKYLRKCIDSLINQTYHHIEIILVDDGSTDNCGIICDEYAKKDSRISVFHKDNGGQGSARNLALDICKGDYIMFVDSDDYVESDFCETALKTVLEKKVLCVSFGYYEIRNNIKNELATRYPRYLNAEDAIERLIRLDDIIYNLPWNKIFHRQLFDAVRFPEGKIYEDQGVIYKLFSNAKSIYVSNDLLYNYVRRNDSTTGLVFSPRAINDKFDIWYERLHFLYTNYPHLIEAEHHQLLELVQTGFVTLSWKKNQKLIKKFKQYLDTYKIDIINYKLNGRLISLYFYCYPLFYLRIIIYRIFHR